MAKILEYDGVIIGAGHNGMICAGYLAKCGQKIMVVEKNMEVGGGLDSHEDRNYPGFWHNIHSVFHRGLMMLPWYKDLELENFGIHYYRPDPGVVHHFLDKTYLGWFSDVQKTVATIERFSKKDASSFMDIWTRWQPVVQKIVFTETYAVPLPFEEKKPLLEKTPEGREYLKYFDTTPEEFVSAALRTSARARVYWLPRCHARLRTGRAQDRLSDTRDDRLGRQSATLPWHVTCAGR